MRPSERIIRDLQKSPGLYVNKFSFFGMRTCQCCKKKIATKEAGALNKVRNWRCAPCKELIAQAEARLTKRSDEAA